MGIERPCWVATSAVLAVASGTGLEKKYGVHIVRSNSNSDGSSPIAGSPPESGEAEVNKGPKKPITKFNNFSMLVKLQLTLANAIAFEIGIVSAAILTQPPVVCETVILTSPLLALGVWGMGGCASVLNQMMEVKYDGLMSRTKDRPLVTGAMSMSTAGAIAVALGASSTALLYPLSPVVAVGSAFNVGLYVLYTWTKRFSEINLHLGALVGLVPPVLGVIAGSMDMTNEAMALAAILGAKLYFWQYPHALSTVLRNLDDYKRAGYAMLPCRDLDATNKSMQFATQMMFATTLVATFAFRLSAWWFLVLAAADFYFIMMPVMANHTDRAGASRTLIRTGFGLIAILGLFVAALWSRRGERKEELEQAIMFEEAELRLLLEDEEEAAKGKESKLAEGQAATSSAQ